MVIWQPTEAVSLPSPSMLREILLRLGILEGFPDGQFYLEREITRAQWTKMLVVSNGLQDAAETIAKQAQVNQNEDQKAGVSLFSDVPVTHWAYGYLVMAKEYHMVEGYPDGFFQPEKKVTYLEAITMMVRTLGYQSVAEAQGVWPTGYWLQAVDLQLFREIDSHPALQAVTRDKALVLVWNMLQAPMWRIYESNQKLGMSYRAGKSMLAIRFPQFQIGSLESNKEISDESEKC